MIIDLRSDTVTQPTPAMKQAMFDAEVGDDVFGDDPTVNLLEKKTAALFGKEAALFCSSGTQTNQLAIRVHTEPGSEVVCDENSHIYLYEGGGIMLNSLSSVRLLKGDRGRLTAGQVQLAVNNPDDIHAPVTRLVSLENTMNKGGGSYYNFSEIEQIRSVCDRTGIPLHLDGARLFNALVETPETPLHYGKTFDTISICLSKGLGCPVGSLLIGSKAHITKARRYRKVMGGGWRQAGFLAAAGIYALDHHIERLREDHKRAKTIGELLTRLPFVEEIYPIDTNIVIFRVDTEIGEKAILQKLEAGGIRAVGFGKNLIRLVTHLDFNDRHLEELSLKLNQII